MDSLTQALLGAAVAEASVGRRVGRRATLYGALLGTLPDLDTLVSLGDPVSDFTYHRSASHSLVVLTAAAPLLAWMLHALCRRARAPGETGSRGPPQAGYRRWLLATWLVLTTHVALDCLTIYGTQILWPVSEHPFGLGSVFIIDPVYTVAIAIGVLGVLVLRDRARLGRQLNAFGLLASTLYLAFGVAAQAHVRDFAERSLSRQGLAWDQLAVLAAPFNTLAWRVVVMVPDGYMVAWHSLLAPAADLRLTRYPSEPALLDPIARHWPVRRLQWFTKGFYAVTDERGAISLTDLRMGVEPDRYAFSFVVGRRSGGGVVPADARRNGGGGVRDGDVDRLWGVIRGAEALEPPR